MAKRETQEKLRLRYKPGLNELYDGDLYFRFYQKDYFEDFIDYFAKELSLTKTYKKIAEICFADHNFDGKDYAKSIKRRNDIVLFTSPKEISITENIAGKIIDMLFALQEDAGFNPKHHTYIDQIGNHKEKRFVYKWEEQKFKWRDILNLDDAKKNYVISGYIYELINIMTESDFYNLKIVDQTYAENGYYDNKIKEIYSMIDELYLYDPVMNEKWIHIMNPIKDMIHKHEFPGVYDPIWVKANEAITYFDVAYDIAQSNPELFKRINEGTTGLKFSIVLDHHMIERREKYMAEKMEEDHRGNAHRSHLQLLEEEMKVALKRILVNEFGAL